MRTTALVCLAICAVYFYLCITSGIDKSGWRWGRRFVLALTMCKFWGKL
jgi:hypothetical protein